MRSSESQAYLTEWRGLEDQFFRTVLSAADLYMLGIRLVRAIAESLKPIDDLVALVAHFERGSQEDVIPIADALEEPQVVLLDYRLARGAAYHLRAREILEGGTEADLRARIEAARARGDAWVVLIDCQTRRAGRTFFQRLEMRLQDGFAVLTASELDWEKGQIFVAEPLLLDPRTGRRLTGTPAPGPARACTTAEEMQRIADNLRQRPIAERSVVG